MKLYDVHNEYRLGHLTEAELTDTPYPLIEKWLNDVGDKEAANIMSLATCGKDLHPLQRIVLLKEITETNLVFFTNYNSRKGQQIAENPQVSLLFSWPHLQRQIQITGIAEKTSRQDSEDYFHSRPRESQLAAVASQQSQPIPSRESLEEDFNRLHDKYPNEVPCPEHWGGFCVEYQTVEFWQGGAYRLHDRFLYTKETTHWKIERLAP